MERGLFEFRRSLVILTLKDVTYGMPALSLNMVLMMKLNILSLPQVVPQHFLWMMIHFHAPFWVLVGQKKAMEFTPLVFNRTFFLSFLYLFN